MRDLGWLLLGMVGGYAWLGFRIARAWTEYLHSTPDADVPDDMIEMSEAQLRLTMPGPVGWAVERYADHKMARRG